MLKEGACRKRAIEIMFFEPCHKIWKTIKIKCTEPYRPEILFEEVKSWLQKEVYETVQWELIDEEGIVDIAAQRNPRDGERYVVLSPEVTQELREVMNARFKSFLHETRWRRIE
jgi:hypothetical protein